MNAQEWEALCDGCGQCCLHKLIDDETNDVLITNVACKLLDGQTCGCKDYPNRKKIVKDCVQLDYAKLKTINWLPRTCAYRLLYLGKKLHSWHHLISGSKESVHTAKISVRAKTVSEKLVKDITKHIQYRLKP